MKKVLLIARARSNESKQKAENFANRIRMHVGDEVTIETSEISELFFALDESDMDIYHPQKGFHIRDFDLVILRHVGKMAEEAHAITLYCDYYGIKYTDSYLNRPLIDNKMSTAFMLWTQGTRYLPKTFYGPTNELVHRFAELGSKAVLKANISSKGKLNFVVKTEDDIRRLVNTHPESRFLLQEFIASNSDLRVLVFHYKPVLVIKRTGDGTSHLNNTSQGGNAEIIPLDQLSQAIIETSVAAARTTQLEVAGVDIIIDSVTGKFYILEVNNAPQISSGSFLEEKSMLYAKMIEDILR